MFQRFFPDNMPVLERPLVIQTTSSGYRGLSVNAYLARPPLVTQDQQADQLAAALPSHGRMTQRELTTIVRSCFSNGNVEVKPAVAPLVGIHRFIASHNDRKFVVDVNRSFGTCRLLGGADADAALLKHEGSGGASAVCVVMTASGDHRADRAKNLATLTVDQASQTARQRIKEQISKIDAMLTCNAMKRNGREETVFLGCEDFLGGSDIAMNHCAPVDAAYEAISDFLIPLSRRFPNVTIAPGSIYVSAPVDDAMRQRPLRIKQDGAEAPVAGMVNYSANVMPVVRNGKLICLARKGNHCQFQRRTSDGKIDSFPINDVSADLGAGKIIVSNYREDNLDDMSEGGRKGTCFVGQTMLPGERESIERHLLHHHDPDARVLGDEQMSSLSGKEFVVNGEKYLVVVCGEFRDDSRTARSEVRSIIDPAGSADDDAMDATRYDWILHPTVGGDLDEKMRALTHRYVHADFGGQSKMEAHAEAVGGVEVRFEEQDVIYLTYGPSGGSGSPVLRTTDGARRPAVVTPAATKMPTEAGTLQELSRSLHLLSEENVDERARHYASAEGAALVAGCFKVLGSAYRDYPERSSLAGHIVADLVKLVNDGCMRPEVAANLLLPLNGKAPDPSPLSFAAEFARSGHAANAPDVVDNWIEAMPKPLATRFTRRRDHVEEASMDHPNAAADKKKTVKRRIDRPFYPRGRSASDVPSPQQTLGVGAVGKFDDVTFFAHLDSGAARQITRQADSSATIARMRAQLKTEHIAKQEYDRNKDARAKWKLAAVAASDAKGSSIRRDNKAASAAALEDVARYRGFINKTHTSTKALAQDREAQRNLAVVLAKELFRRSQEGSGVSRHPLPDSGEVSSIRSVTPFSSYAPSLESLWNGSWASVAPTDSASTIPESSSGSRWSLATADYCPSLQALIEAEKAALEGRAGVINDENRLKDEALLKLTKEADKRSKQYMTELESERGA